LQDKMKENCKPFLKTEWKVSGTGTAHWASSFVFCFPFLVI
jgi:hypothetical protein